MRDYKGHTSHSPLGAAPAFPPPVAGRRLSPSSEREEAPETDLPLVPSRRRGHFWLWFLLFLLCMISVGIWWVVASLPIGSNLAGMFPAGSGGRAGHTAQAPGTMGSPPVPGVPSAAAPAEEVSPSPGAAVSLTGSTFAQIPALQTPAASSRSGIDFNFYRILPAMKVDVPADILGSGPGIPGTAVAQSGDVVPPQPVTIQVGAFSNLAGARVLQERLALMGIRAYLEKIRGGGGQTYYRVRTQTYASLADAQQALAKIRGLGVTPVLQGNNGASGVMASGSGAVPAP